MKQKFYSIARGLRIHLALSHVLTLIAGCYGDGVYNTIDGGLLCLNANFIKNYSDFKEVRPCAFLCDQTQSCQAFTISDGLCQLFVFNKCSKSVKDCSCTKRGQVFVRQQPGLPPGALCPSAYTDDLCGVKYFMYYGAGQWLSSRSKCESDNGLVILADVIDATEMSWVDSLYSKYGYGSFWLGGYQTPGSPEPAGGWYWVACNLPLDGSLWGSGEPNNGNSGTENTVGRWSSHDKLSDFSQYSNTPKAVLCECVSPFI